MCCFNRDNAQNICQIFITMSKILAGHYSTVFSSSETTSRCCKATQKQSGLVSFHALSPQIEDFHTPSQVKVVI